MAKHTTDRRLDSVEAALQAQTGQNPANGQVIIYDAATGEPYTTPVADVQIWLPDNGRGGMGGPYPHAQALKAAAGGRDVTMKVVYDSAQE